MHTDQIAASCYAQDMRSTDCKSEPLPNDRAIAKWAKIKICSCKSQQFAAAWLRITFVILAAPNYFLEIYITLHTHQVLSIAP